MVAVIIAVYVDSEFEYTRKQGASRPMRRWRSGELSCRTRLPGSNGPNYLWGLGQ